MNNIIKGFLIGIILCICLATTEKGRSVLEVKPVIPVMVKTQVVVDGYYNQEHHLTEVQKYIISGIKKGYIVKSIISLPTVHSESPPATLVVMEKY
jgi:hypothetical protein